MLLPVDFQFNQNKLQDYLDCPKKFQLRYIDKMAWPALISEPANELELSLSLGSLFHQAIHQFFLGVDTGLIEAYQVHPQQKIWWNSFLTHFHMPSNARIFTELDLRSPFMSYHLIAKYDLLLFDSQESVIIYDWKTTKNYPKRQWLMDKAQTLVYPLMLTLAGKSINQGLDISASSIKMVYWFANHPEKPIEFQYDDYHFIADQKRLKVILKEIESNLESEFPKTEDPRQCKFCNFRSYCSRGVEAGIIDKETESSYISEGINLIDFDQIEEIPW